jgi:signal transduction histidine kinase
MSQSTRLLKSVAFRLALGYGALVVGAMIIISAVFYFGTVGIIDRSIDSKLVVVSQRLTDRFEANGVEALQQQILQLLRDGVDQDTEVYLLLDAAGRKIVGNLSAPGGQSALDRLSDQTVDRDDRSSTSRLLPHQLSNGDVLVVGRDLQDLREIEQLVMRALLVGGAVGMLLAVGGAVLFRRKLERRVAAIRRTAMEIESGDLSRRIPELDADDEFTRLSADINRMLDRIQHLMNGVRDISNAVAHDLRTPLGRIRSLLDEALRPGTNIAKFREAARTSIHSIDELIMLFDKLLQIAEAESGTRRHSFRPVALRQIIMDVVELYDAMAEANGIALVMDADGEPIALGDKDLLTSATANLVDNALKYAGHAATVSVRAIQDRNAVSIVVQDNGPGIPPAEREKVLTRFYRLDRSRSFPGNGLGLAIVTAISHLHSGSLSLEDTGPGLTARIVLPHPDISTLPNANVMEMVRTGTLS